MEKSGVLFQLIRKPQDSITAELAAVPLDSFEKHPAIFQNCVNNASAKNSDLHEKYMQSVTYDNF